MTIYEFMNTNSQPGFTRESPKITIFNRFFINCRKLKINFSKLREIARDRFFFITSQDIEVYVATEIIIILCYTFFVDQKEN